MTRISLRPRAVAGFHAAPEKYRLKIRAALDAFERGSFPPHTEKLEGTPKGYRTRIGRWRILFVLRLGEIDGADIFVKKGRGDYRARLR